MDKPFPIFSLPREIRDEIYLATLLSTPFNSPHSHISTIACKNHNRWYPVREWQTPFYYPLQIYRMAYHRDDTSSKCNENCTEDNLRWKFNTRIIPTPTLFQIGGQISREAQEVYYSASVLLDANIVTEDWIQNLDTWIAKTGAENLNLIRRLHMNMRMHMPTFGTPSDPNDAISQKLASTPMNQIKIMDPIFRIEIRDSADGGGGERLLVLSAVELLDITAARLRCAVQDWVAREDLVRHPIFTGRDIVGAARALITATKAIKAFRLWAHVPRYAIADVYEYTGDAMPEGKGLVVRLKETYPNVVAEFKTKRLDEVEEPIDKLLAFKQWYKEVTGRDCDPSSWR